MRRGWPHLSIRLKVKGGRRHRRESPTFPIFSRYGMVDAAEQRRQGRAVRRALSPRERRRQSERACRLIARLAVFRRARRIGLYWPLPSEADPRFLYHHLRAGQHLYLPRVVGDRLEFVAWREGNTRWRRAALGMHEPRNGRRMRPTALDLVVMPLTAFDSAGHRIGMGGGFYDRAFALGAALHRRPYLLGLAFPCQHVGPITPAAWDVNPDAIATHRGIR